jgi:hypothetical protein
MTTPPSHPRIEYRDPTSGARLFDVYPVAKSIVVRLRGIEHVGCVGETGLQRKRGGRGAAGDCW